MKPRTRNTSKNSLEFGMARWGTEISRVDIFFEILLLLQYQAIPREDHMEQLLHIWGFLKKNPKLTLYFDPPRPRLDCITFITKREEFKEQYRDAEEKMPNRMFVPRERPVISTVLLDASYAANKKTKRSKAYQIRKLCKTQAQLFIP